MISAPAVDVCNREGADIWVESPLPIHDTIFTYISPRRTLVQSVWLLRQAVMSLVRPSRTCAECIKCYHQERTPKTLFSHRGIRTKISVRAYQLYFDVLEGVQELSDSQKCYGTWAIHIKAYSLLAPFLLSFLFFFSSSPFIGHAQAVLIDRIAEAKVLCDTDNVSGELLRQLTPPLPLQTRLTSFWYPETCDCQIVVTPFS